MKRETEATQQQIYGRAYTIAMKKVRKLREQYGRAFAAIRERAERAEGGHGYGKCSECAFWSRATNRHWGYCGINEAIKQYPDWPMPWAHVEKSRASRPEARFVTYETFGCVLFKISERPGDKAMQERKP